MWKFANRIQKSDLKLQPRSAALVNASYLHYWAAAGLVAWNLNDPRRV
jgi:hypothetical protein